MSDELKPSKPADFTPECALVELRKNEAGESIHVLIRAVPLSKISALFGGLPSQAAPRDPDAPKEDPTEVARKEQEAGERLYSVLRDAAIEPRLRFEGDPEDVEAVYWNDLDKGTQDAWVRAIMVHSGFALPLEAEALVTFRTVRRGGLQLCRGSS